jgi:hypothetical protein
MEDITIERDYTVLLGPLTHTVGSSNLVLDSVNITKIILLLYPLSFSLYPPPSIIL